MTTSYKKCLAIESLPEQVTLRGEFSAVASANAGTTILFHSMGLIAVITLRRSGIEDPKSG
jgi:hypothetical protein